MEGVLAVVDGERVGLAVEREASLGDAIGVAADERPEVSRLAGIAVERVEAEDDVGELAGLVGDGERDDDAAVGGDAGLAGPLGA